VKFWKRRKLRSPVRTSDARKSDRKSDADARTATKEHFERFIATRVGVEAFVEPATHVTSATMVLIANTGEWTRRKVPSLEEGWKLARQLEIPVYDVNQVGYPARMREWNSKKREQWRKNQDQV